MPGLGNYILVSTDSGDLPGVLAVVVLASFAVAILALVADIVYAYLDPRVRYCDERAPARGPRPPRALPHRRRPGEGRRRGEPSRSSKGETLGVVGESGSGKSVTFMTVMGLINRKTAQVSGEVLFRGTDLLADPGGPAARGSAASGIGMVFQDPMTSLHPMCRVGDQIAEGVLAHRNVRRAVADADGRRRAAAASGSPRPSSAPASTRTSSPAACASAR